MVSSHQVSRHLMSQRKSARILVTDIGQSDTNNDASFPSNLMNSTSDVSLDPKHISEILRR